MLEIYRMLTSIIIESSGTKMGKCDEIIFISNIRLMMHMKAAMQLFTKNQGEFMMLSILITLKCSHLSAAICNFTSDTIKF